MNTAGPPSGTHAPAATIVAAAAPTDPTIKQKGAAKTARIPIKVPVRVESTPVLKKPDWIRVKLAPASSRFDEIKRILRENRLHTVCEEASCPNIGECFGKGTATFMIMGDKCTRRCPFCDVGHGRPDPLDAAEPTNLARTIAALGLAYVVITSVDRDDLRDGGAARFVSISRDRQARVWEAAAAAGAGAGERGACRRSTRAGGTGTARAPGGCTWW